MKNLTQRPVKNALLVMTVPVLIGMLTTFLFQLVDAYFVGQLGTEELAAISFAYPVYIIIIAIFIGIEAGVSSSVGKALGEENNLKAKALIFVSLITFMIFAGILGIVGYFTIPQVFSLLGASRTMIPYITDYMEILYPGIWILVGGLTINAALMAKGVTVRPSIVMGIGGIINLVLDYILIFGLGPVPAMALKGAAWATVISWSVILILMMILLKREHLLSLKSFTSLTQIRTHLYEIMVIGSPAVVAQVLAPIALAVLTRLVSGYGEEAVAAFGIASRVESLGLTGIIALSVIMTPVVAQNYGAGSLKRLDEVIAFSGRLVVYWGALFFLFLLISAKWIGSIFTDDPQIISYSETYFYYLGISYPGFGLLLITTSFFNGVYQPKRSLILTLVKSFAFTIPFALVGSVISLQGIWAGLSCANIFGGIYAGRMLGKWLRENDSSLVGHNPIFDYWKDLKLLIGKITPAFVTRFFNLH